MIKAASGLVTWPIKRVMLTASCRHSSWNVVGIVARRVIGCMLARRDRRAMSASAPPQWLSVAITAVWLMVADRGSRGSRRIRGDTTIFGGLHETEGWRILLSAYRYRLFVFVRILAIILRRRLNVGWPFIGVTAARCSRGARRPRGCASFTKWRIVARGVGRGVGRRCPAVFFFFRQYRICGGVDHACGLRVAGYLHHSLRNSGVAYRRTSACRAYFCDIVRGGWLIARPGVTCGGGSACLLSALGAIKHFHVNIFRTSVSLRVVVTASARDSCRIARRRGHPRRRITCIVAAIAAFIVLSLSVSWRRQAYRAAPSA